MTAYQSSRNAPVPPPAPDLYRRLQFVAKMLRDAPPAAAGRRLLWVDQDGVVVAHSLGAETLIGRDPSCAIVLTSRRTSRKHCAIYGDGTLDEIVDLNSANGTQVNGVQIQRRILADGDMIELGGCALAYTNAISITPAPGLSLGVAPA